MTAHELIFPIAEPTEGFDQPAQFPEESARIAAKRRLQSEFRERELKARAGAHASYERLGSYLHPDDVAEEPRLNFITEAAYRHAIDRAEEVQTEGGSLERARLMHNMLSSMPLCFNIFGALKDDAEAFLELFQTVFDGEAIAIHEVVCEWAPQPRERFLDDRTAFDALVRYETPAGTHFMGVETKYTEPFSAKEYRTERYDALTTSSDWFVDGDGTVEALSGKSTNQLWRNALLASALETEGSTGRGRVAVLSLDDDVAARTAVEGVRKHLTDETRLLHTSLERLLNAARSIETLAPWADVMTRRYLG